MTKQRDALAAAIEKDHSCECTYCDICAAMRAGFVEVAAQLLDGATETPALDAHAAKLGRWATRKGVAVGWSAWVKWFRANSLKCEGCGAFTFQDQGECTTCENCGTQLTFAR